MRTPILGATLSVVTATLILGVYLAANAGLPKTTVVINERTALVVTDPQSDFLSPNGVAWGVVGKSVTENGTVENLETLFKVAKSSGIPVFISPHYYFPTDHGWRFEGALEKLMHDIGMFDRKGPLDLEGFDGSGADWLATFALSRICVNSSSKGSRLPSSGMPRPLPSSKRATASKHL